MLHVHGTLRVALQESLAELLKRGTSRDGVQRIAELLEDVDLLRLMLLLGVGVPVGTELVPGDCRFGVERRGQLNADVALPSRISVPSRWRPSRTAAHT